jgi:hypothetical protein
MKSWDALRLLSRTLSPMLYVADSLCVQAVRREQRN